MSGFSGARGAGMWCLFICSISTSGSRMVDERRKRWLVGADGSLRPPRDTRAGAYIQIGACTDVSVNKATMAGHRLWQLEVIVSGLRPTLPRRQVSSASHGSLVFESHSPAAHRVPLHGKLVLRVVGA